MQRSVLVLLLFVLTAIAACASQGASGGGGGSTDVVVLNGCRVDPARICNNAREGSVDASGTRWMPFPLEDASGAAYFMISVKRLNGDELFMVDCGINTLTLSITWAHVKTGPPVTDDDAKYLRARDYCSEP